MQDTALPTSNTDVISAKDSWPHLWQHHGDFWPDSATAAFPFVHSSIYVWMQTTMHESAKLLSMLRCFPYPEDLFRP